MRLFQFGVMGQFLIAVGLLGCAASVGNALLFPDDLKQITNDEGKTWALIVAGSNEWDNYRHQADACHAYHVLINHGIPAENIVTMMYDDIANNTNNPYSGKIFNRPNGSEVYTNVKIDYREEDVNVHNFFAILKGEKDKVKGGNGRVLESTKNDRIFVFYVDHEDSGIMAMINEEITVKQLHGALKSMHKKESYKEITFYVETCNSGSMFKTLPKNLNVYAMTAANHEESSWACYCNSHASIMCYADCFSLNWMHDSNKNNLLTETLQTQYSHVKNKTTTSHVMQYGELKIAKEHVSNFQGNKTKAVIFDDHENDVDEYEQWPVKEIPVKALESKLKQASNNADKQSIQKELDELLEKRAYLNEHLKSFVQKMIKDPSTQNHVLNDYPEDITQIDCHHDLVKTYSQKCFNIGKNSYANNYIKVLTNMCELGMDSKLIERTLTEHCSNIKYQNIV